MLSVKNLGYNGWRKSEDCEKFMKRSSVGNDSASCLLKRCGIWFMVSNQTCFKLTNKLCSFNFEFMLFYVSTDQQAPNSNISRHLNIIPRYMVVGCWARHWSIKLTFCGVRRYIVTLLLCGCKTWVVSCCYIKQQQKKNLNPP